MTTVTLIAGWWGVISFFLTPIILIGNVVQYLGARKAFRSGTPGSEPVEPGIAAVAAPAGAAPAPWRGAAPAVTAGGPRKGLAVASLALGVTGLLCDAYADADSKAFGNTEEARAMAERFSRVIKAVDKLAFTGQRDTGPSLSQGRFLTYVELRQDSVCFLVHVPQLRAYDGEVRRSLLDLAWMTAREASRDVRKERDLRLGVGLRGAVAYGAVAVGMGEAKPTQELRSVVSTAPLEAFFTGPAWKAPARLTATTMPEAPR